MARYIDADMLTDMLEEIQFNAPVMTPVMKIYNVIELVADTPTADVVEVVRCRDCKYRYSYEEFDRDRQETYMCSGCHMLHKDVGDNSFCSYGERKL